MRLTSILLLTHLLSLTAASPQLASIVSRGVPATEPGAVFNWFQKRAGELEADPEEEEEVSTGYTSISTTGSNAWMPPGPNDKRGPCPALNALSNHGYLPRNGIVSMLSMVSTVNKVYGMSTELGLTLSVLATVLVGDLLYASVPPFWAF